ncbi:MAG: hypothetical protein HC795_13045 [Coleofasciculaceae cyanobacterium RL_1_1]|nr:hypothetical protein [Coleofasciculaceae cyanobacterium RL_1_1]
MRQQPRQSLKFSVCLLAAIGAHAVLLWMPSGADSETNQDLIATEDVIALTSLTQLSPEESSPEPIVTAPPDARQPKAQPPSSASTSPNNLPATPKDSNLAPEAQPSPPPKVNPSTPPSRSPDLDSDQEKSPASPSPTNLPTPTPTNLPTPTPTPSPEIDSTLPEESEFPHFTGAETGCYGSEQCHRVAGESLRSVASQLKTNLEAQGYQFKQRDDLGDDAGFRVYEISKDQDVQFLHIFSEWSLDQGDTTLYELSAQPKSLRELRAGS